MNKTLKRALSGAVYVTIMWFGTLFNEYSRNILFLVITLISTYEMWKLRKGKKNLLYIIYVWGFMISILLESEEILFIFILTWTFDTFAYLVGITFGENKILPSVSPKKSWEGFVGGIFFTVIASCLSVNYFELFSNIQNSITISLILPFTATTGDFIESYIKRQARVKDSGNLIPGHGGMLDRIDSFMITIPVFYLLTRLL